MSQNKRTEKIKKLKEDAISNFNTGDSTFYLKLQELGLDDKLIHSLVVEKNEQKTAILDLKKTNLELIQLIEEQDKLITKFENKYNNSKNLSITGPNSWLIVLVIIVAFVLSLIISYSIVPEATIYVLSFIINLMEKLSNLINSKGV